MDHVITGEVQGIGSITGDVSGAGAVSGGISVFDTPPYAGPYTVTPTESAQTLETQGKNMLDNVTVEAMPEGQLDDEYTITHYVPNMTVSSTGLVTVNENVHKYITPVSRSGHIDSSAVWQPALSVYGQMQLDSAAYKNYDAFSVVPEVGITDNGLVWGVVNSAETNFHPIKTNGWATTNDNMPVAFWGTKDKQLDTVDGTTITPTESEQTAVAAKHWTKGDVKVGAIPDDYVGSGVTRKTEETYVPNKTAPQVIQAGQYLTGDQTVGKIPDEYYDMSGDLAWLGAGAELVQTWTLDNKKLSQTDFASWTPSTTAKDILAARTAGTFVADMANYDYYLIWKTGIPFVVDSSATKKALPILTASYQVQQIIRRPNTWAQIEESTFATNLCASAYTQNFMRYYGTTTGAATYSWGVSYGIYATVTAATFSNSTSDTPTVTVKSPKVSARCSNSYMSTANAALIDKDKTVISQTCYVYRVKKGTSFMRGIYQENTKFINEVK